MIRVNKNSNVYTMDLRALGHRRTKENTQGATENLPCDRCVFLQFSAGKKPEPGTMPF